MAVSRAWHTTGWGLARLRGGAFRAMWSVGDQALISVSNFLTTIVVARATTPEAFGAFTLVYTALLFAVSTQTSLICQPHNVLAATRTGAAYRAFTTSSALVQVVFAAMSGLLVLAVAGLSVSFGWSVTPLLLALAPTVVVWELQEFVRRVLYTEGKVGAAFVNDIVSYGGQAVTVLAWSLHGSLTGAEVILLMGASSGIAALLGVLQLSASLQGEWTWSAVQDNWRYGKWLAGSELVGNWLGDQFYLIVATPILGVSAAGVIKAMQVLFGPNRLIVMAVNTVTPIRAARALERGGPGAFRREYTRVLLIVLPFIVLYCGAAMLAARFALNLAYGTKYLAYVHIFQLYAVYVLISSGMILVSSVLRALQQTQAIFRGRLVGGVAAMALAWPLIHFLGLSGIVLGLLLGAALTVGLLVRLLMGGVAPTGGQDGIQLAPAATHP